MREEMSRYRKKPLEIDAMKWIGDNKNAMDTFLAWAGCNKRVTYYRDVNGVPLVKIPTLEGDMLAFPGDWIVVGIAGEPYPCKNDIFEKTYERV
jgi:hypothetical protein